MLNSDAVKDLLTYVPEWAETTVDVAEGAGNLQKKLLRNVVSTAGITSATTDY